jgi:hypothetical protein
MPLGRKFFANLINLTATMTPTEEYGWTLTGSYENPLDLDKRPSTVTTGMD